MSASLGASREHDLRLSCARAAQHDPPPAAAAEPTPRATETPAASPTSPTPTPAVAQEPPPDPRTVRKTWLAGALPTGGELVEDSKIGDQILTGEAAPARPALVVHVAGERDTLLTIAARYVDLTTAYTARELASSIVAANGGLTPSGVLRRGTRVTIPRVLDAPPATPAAARLPWPDDRSLRGIYANPTMTAGTDLPETLDRMAARGMNAIVVDAKDVTGTLTYPSKVPLAVETKATRNAGIPSLERLVRVAHARGIRVVARIACFRDEYLGPRRGDLAVQARAGGPHRAPSHIVDWLDPANDDVQRYLVAIVEETIAAGVDEVQLDYVRYPTEGVWDADFKLKSRDLTTVGVITSFVQRVHDVTHAAKVPLSLDVFGVVAWRYLPDVEATGQDLTRLTLIVEALSPMVYPSHFNDGFSGYAMPGDHPEVVAIGTRRAVELVKSTGSTTLVRPWVQAFPWKSPHFGSPYIADQIREAKHGGGVGWLAWNSGGQYGATFMAVPVLAKK